VSNAPLSYLEHLKILTSGCVRQTGLVRCSHSANLENDAVDLANESLLATLIFGLTLKYEDFVAKQQQSAG
jgi:hypothetical protein